MKKSYLKPQLDRKAYAQFENVFTACNKGNAVPQGCQSGVASHPSEDPSQTAAFPAQGSI